MTASAASQSVRKGLYAKIHIARKELRLDEETYRDMLAERYGVRTASKMSIAGLEDLVAHFVNLGWKPSQRAAPKRAGSRKASPGREARKARALWISLFHMGVVADPSEAALAAYARRQTKIEAPEWIHEWRPVIEGLKEWAARAAGVDWSGYAVYGQRALVERPRCRVLEAQWRILLKSGQVKNYWGLDGYACRILCRPSGQIISNMTPEEQDRVIEALGAQVRAGMERPA